MKKVLIITCWYPPHPYPSLRIVGLAKYLPEFGWQPTILAPSLGDLSPQFRVIETPYQDSLDVWKRLFGFNSKEDIRRQIDNRFRVTSGNRLADFIFTRVGEFINYPDSYRGWKPFAVKTGSEILQKEGVDALLSSAMPVISHLIANELKSQYRVPWVADFRDLWTQNHEYSYGFIRKLLDERLELKTLSKADALVTVSQPWAEKLSLLHRGKVTYAIPNGFDPAEVNIPPAKLTDKFTITYTGSFYSRKQEDPTKLLTALRELLSEGTVNPDDIEVRFYGAEVDWLDREIKQYELSSIVKQHGEVPRQIALQRQRESQLLLLFDWDDPQEKGVYPGKVFEYLAARRPILASGGSSGNVIEALLNETKAGVCARTMSEIKNTLKELYGEYRLKHRVTYYGKESKSNKYSQQEMARKFSEILGQVSPVT